LSYLNLKFDKKRMENRLYIGTMKLKKGRFIVDNEEILYEKRKCH